MKNFVQPGKTMTAALGAAVTAGDLVIIGVLAAVANGNYAANEQGEYELTGVYTFTALGTAVGAQGAIAYWDQTNKRITDVATNNSAVGHFFVAKANGDATATVRLVQRLA